MPVNPHSYPHEKIGNGLRSLMSFSMAPEERIQAALVELHITYGHNTPSGRALEHGNRIQVERTTAYAQRKGWTVAPEHVYQDDGISGAEFVKRPGFLRLMNALKPRPGFQVLIMNEESRLGRGRSRRATRSSSSSTPACACSPIWTTASGRSARRSTR